MPLRFLEKGVSYEADVYRDGDSKTALVKEKKTVTRSDVLTLPMQPGGRVRRARASARPALAVSIPTVARVTIRREGRRQR